MKRYFNRFKILHKIIISVFVFALPVCILLFYMISGFNNNIEFARKEVWGSKLLSPLTTLSELVSQHQLLVRLFLQGNTNVQDRIDHTAKKIDEAFDTLFKEGKRYERALRFDVNTLKSIKMEEIHYSNAHAMWQELRKNYKKIR